jgi:hypothetical protein
MPKGNPLFGDGDDAHAAALRAAHTDRAEVWSEINGFQAVQHAVRTQYDDA